MSVPTHLNHKPILGISEYDRIDGPYKNDTDTRAISIGLAQWSADWKLEESDISVKIWRSNGDRWSRMSEEMPIHRALDLATLVCVAKKYAEKKELPLTGDGFPVSRITSNPAFHKHVDILANYFDKHEDDIKNSLLNLKKALNELDLD